MNLNELLKELEHCAENASVLDEKAPAVKIRLKGGEVFEVVGISWDEDSETVTLMAL